MDVEHAAAILGVKPDAVRKRLRRGTLPGRRIGESWHVDLELPQAAPQAAEPSRRERRAEPQAAPHADRDALVEQLRAENTHLWAELERRGVELAEMRRLLAMATPALPAVISSDAEPSSETVGAPPDALTLAAAVQQAAKSAGLRKKQRRALREQLAGLFRR